MKKRDLTSLSEDALVSEFKEGSQTLRAFWDECVANDEFYRIENKAIELFIYTDEQFEVLDAEFSSSVG